MPFEMPLRAFFFSKAQRKHKEFEIFGHKKSGLPPKRGAAQPNLKSYDREFIPSKIIEFKGEGK